MGTLRVLFDRLQERFPDDRQRGKQFEHICKHFLQKAPKYSDQFTNVWLWNEWPDRWGSDAGIDLVAKTVTGELWAIQAKCWRPNSYLPKKEIDSFLAQSSRHEISHRMLISTTRDLSQHAQKQLDAAGVTYLLWDHLDRMSFSWPDDWPLPSTSPATNGCVHPGPGPVARKSSEKPGYEVGGNVVAGFGIRLGAYVLDVVIILAAAFFLSFLLPANMQGVLALGIIIALIVYQVFCWSIWGGTPGKLMLGLRIVSVDGDRIGFGTSLVRTLGYYLSSAIFKIGFIWILFDRQNQGWHDKIAGTFVVHYRKLPAPGPRRTAPEPMERPAPNRPYSPSKPKQADQMPPKPRTGVGSQVPPVTLTVVQGKEIGKRYSVSSTPATVGRASHDDISIKGDRHISRAQVAMIFEDNAWKIEDHGAKNPLQVNGNVVRSATLRNSDRIKVGETVLEFQS